MKPKPRKWYRFRRKRDMSLTELIEDDALLNRAAMIFAISILTASLCINYACPTN